MQVHYGFENAKGIRNPVVTVGSFDGVHIGHKTILDRINQIANQIGGESVLISFYPHPRKVLYPETHGRDLKFISSQKEKIHLLGKAGLGHLIFVKFTLEFARITSEEFIRKLLVESLGARAVVVGFNHHFGHNRQGDFSYLHSLSKELGFIVEEIPEQDIHNETVSSTTIRKAIADGKVQRANAYLDHQYILIGALGRGSRSFTAVDYPTLSVQIEELGKLIPPSGLYAVSVEWNNHRYRAMAIVWSQANNDPSSDAQHIVEVHLFDFDFQFPSDDAMLLFHKGVVYGNPPLEHDKLKKFLSQGVQEVNELIY